MKDIYQIETFTVKKKSNQNKSMTQENFLFFINNLDDHFLQLIQKMMKGGLVWILGNISSERGWSSIGTGSPGNWWNHNPWKCSKTL